MVDTFCNTDGSASILRIETTLQEKEVKIPPFVKVLREVTNDINYSSRTMALMDYKMPAADKKEILK
jgi:homoaconitase/3-isopropylmalate dehydratase large subunit